MAQLPLSAGMPQAPFVVPGTGDITLVWRMFLTALWTRTGAGQGVDLAGYGKALAAEVEARRTADLVLTADIAAETLRAENAETALRDGLTAEMQTRAHDDILGRAYTDQRIADAVALLVPIAQLCSMWSQCNWLFLPRTDPGNGQVWLDADGKMTVGLVPPAPAIGIEAGGDQWVPETGLDNWTWG